MFQPKLHKGHDKPSPFWLICSYATSVIKGCWASHALRRFLRKCMTSMSLPQDDQGVDGQPNAECPLYVMHTSAYVDKRTARFEIQHTSSTACYI